MRTGPSLLLLAPLAFSACNRDAVQPVDLGLEYYPVNVGKWVEYEVDSSWYDERINVSGTRNYMLRELILENFTDPAGRPAQRIHRFVQDSTGAWRIRDVWWQTRDNYAAEKTEEDQRRLKLSFPVRTDRTWNVNAYNPGVLTTVRYANLHQFFAINGLAFDSTVMVRGTYPNNPIDTLIHEERYAKHVGMVQTYRVESSTQWNQLTQQYETKGWKLRMEATAFGN